MLIRRLIDAEKAGEGDICLDSRFPASLADVAAFLDEQVDDFRLEDLLWGLILVDPKEATAGNSLPTSDFFIPRAYALLKLALLPWKVEWKTQKGNVRLVVSEPGRAGGIAIKPEAAILAKLRASDVQGACEVALRRLRSSRLTPLASHRGDNSRREIRWSDGVASADRLLAALFFPIAQAQVSRLADLVLRRPEIESFT